MSDVQTSTPGAVNQIAEIVFRGETFRIRRPSRADEAAINRRLALKLMESPTLRDLDGPWLEWEARLEVCLTPRSEALNLGECAPDYLIREGIGGERIITFERIDQEDFRELIEALRPAFASKKSKPSANSGSSAGGLTNA